MRLIDADALEKIVTEKFKEHYGNTVYQFIHDFFRCVLRLIRKAPTIEAEPVRHGRWELHEESSDLYCHHRCTNCKVDAPFDYKYIEDWDEGMDGEWYSLGITENGINEHLTPYCPNCGAKMDGGAENG